MSNQTYDKRHALWRVAFRPLCACHGLCQGTLYRTCRLHLRSQKGSLSRRGVRTTRRAPADKICINFFVELPPFTFLAPKTKPLVSNDDSTNLWVFLSASFCLGVCKSQSNEMKSRRPEMNLSMGPVSHRILRREQSISQCHPCFRPFATVGYGSNPAAVAGTGPTAHRAE